MTNIKSMALEQLSPNRIYEIITLLHATLNRWAPTGTAYQMNCEKIFSGFSPGSGHIANGLCGVLRGLKSDYENDYLISAEELIHADLFSDYLDMAKHLLGEGYKDPAAVIIGSSLEAHLRKLCEKSEIATAKPDGAPLKANTMNDELARPGVYGKSQKKVVTGWLGTRNDAAHGKYDEYSLEQVKLMLDGVRDFIYRYPA